MTAALSISFFPVPHTKYHDDHSDIKDFVDDTILAYPNTISVIGALELSDSRWKRIFREGFNSRDNSRDDFPVQSFLFPKG